MAKSAAFHQTLKMKTVFDTQEIARRFNQDEMAWQSFEEKRRVRDSDSIIPESILDAIDWIEADRGSRQVRCIGLVRP